MDETNILQKQIISNLMSENKKQNKALHLMAEELTTPIHGVEWVVNYYLEKAEGLYD